MARFHHAFPFWLYALFCLVSVLFVVFCVPETKGKTLEVIETMWQRQPAACLACWHLSRRDHGK